MDMDVLCETDQNYEHLPEPREVPIAPNSTLKPPFFKKCLCFSLRTGCLIICYLSLILQFIGGILLLVTSVIKDEVSWRLTIEHLVNSTYEELEDESLAAEPESILVNSLIRISAIMILVLFAILIISEIFLLFGIYKRNTLFLKIYLIINFTIFIMGVMAFTYNLATGANDLTHTIQLVVGFAWMILKLIITYCYFKELKMVLRRTPVYSFHPTEFQSRSNSVPIPPAK